MKIVFARDYNEYAKWLNDNFRYAGDKAALENIDTAKVDSLVMLEGFSKHPLYLSDELHDFQVNVSKARYARINDGS